MNFMSPYHQMALVNAHGLYSKASAHLMTGIEEEEDEEMSTEDKERGDNMDMINTSLNKPKMPKSKGSMKQ